MNLVMAFLILTCIVVAAAVALVLRKIAYPKVNLPITTDWVEELSMDRYRPMMRLLDGGDLEFLCSQSGVSPKIIRGFRRQRCRIFRSYLKQLNTDFACVCMAIKVIMLQSDTDRPDLASKLLRSRIHFVWCLVLVQTRLALYEIGVGTIDAACLLKLFDGMRLELRSLVPASAVWGA
jgi:hypothetical protein